MATQLKKTVKPSGGDHTSLEACLVANQQNLVTADKYFDVEIDGDWSGGADTTAVTLDGYTLNATHYINIYTTAAARHDAKIYDATAYRIETGSTTVAAVTLYRGCKITGIQVYNAATTADDAGVWMLVRYLTLADDGVLTVDKCIFKSSGTSGKYQYGIMLYHDYAWTANFRNCLIYDLLSSVATYPACIATTTGTAAAIINVLNCTIVNCTRSFASIGSNHTFTAKNIGASSVANAAYGTVGYTTSSTSTPTFVGASDYHLDASDTTWKNQGTDLAATFTDDIDGETPTGAGTWDIGCDEYEAAEGSAYNLTQIGSALLRHRAGLHRLIRRAS